MKSYCQISILAGVLALLAGCADRDIQLEPDMATYGRESLKEGEIKFPANYNRENYRKLLLGVVVNKPSVKAGDIPPEISQTLSTRLQTEMAKLKRFSVLSTHNDGTSFFQSLADVGEAKMPESIDPRQLDLILSAAVTISKEKQDRYNDSLLIYEVECDFNCVEIKNKEVKFAEKAKGRTARSVIFIGGRYAGGYDANKEEQAIINAAMKALAVAANKLGNYYPVGGRITGMLGNRMTLDKGFEHGVSGNMQMVVYTTVAGVDVPIAIAEASPSSTTSNLNVWRWNTEDTNARELIEEIRKDRNWLKSNELYAVSYGMATPPEWENAYKDSFDESLRK